MTTNKRVSRRSRGGAVDDRLKGQRDGLSELKEEERVRSLGLLRFPLQQTGKKRERKGKEKRGREKNKERDECFSKSPKFQNGKKSSFGSVKLEFRLSRDQSGLEL